MFVPVIKNNYELFGNTQSPANETRVILTKQKKSAAMYKSSPNLTGPANINSKTRLENGKYAQKTLQQTTQTTQKQVKKHRQTLTIQPTSVYQPDNLELKNNRFLIQKAINPNLSKTPLTCSTPNLVVNIPTIKISSQQKAASQHTKKSKETPQISERNSADSNSAPPPMDIDKNDSGEKVTTVNIIYNSKIQIASGEHVGVGSGLLSKDQQPINVLLKKAQNLLKYFKKDDNIKSDKHHHTGKKKIRKKSISDPQVITCLKSDISKATKQLKQDAKWRTDNKESLRNEIKHLKVPKMRPLSNSFGSASTLSPSSQVTLKSKFIGGRRRKSKSYNSLEPDMIEALKLHMKENGLSFSSSSSNDSSTDSNASLDNSGNSENNAPSRTHSLKKLN